MTGFFTSNGLEISLPPLEVVNLISYDTIVARWRIFSSPRTSVKKNWVTFYSLTGNKYISIILPAYYDTKRTISDVVQFKYAATPRNGIKSNAA